MGDTTVVAKFGQTKFGQNQLWPKSSLANTFEQVRFLLFVIFGPFWGPAFEQVRFLHFVTFWPFWGFPFEQVRFLPFVTFWLFLAPLPPLL